MDKVKKGDKVVAMGLTATIDKIYYQDYTIYSKHWDIEFLDTDGVHRHWKQCFDGGELVRA